MGNPTSEEQREHDRPRAIRAMRAGRAGGQAALLALLEPLGAGLATVALMTEQWLLLAIVGIVFVAEALSDILQVAYFKSTGGKRLFRMAPIHHHFELLGWYEVQITQRFWLIAVAGAMAGIALAFL